LSFKPPKVPSKYGYFDVHESEPVARAAASVSLDAFAVYLGYFSFLVAICQFGIDVQSPIPSWRKLLQRQDSGVHPEWLELLVSSPIVDFTQERLGVVTHVSKCDWLHLASYLIKASVPIWFNWGKIPYYSTPSHSWISDYHPDLDKFTAVVPTNAGLYPPVNSGTGQWYSETMEQFFARRHKRDQAVKAKETPLERQKRLSREQAQQSRPYPGKKGPAVFCWDDVNGFRIRTPIPRQKVENIWNNWSNSQKIYNAIDNCWDCCVIFAINSLPGEPDSSDTDSDSDLDLPCVCISPQPPPAPNSRDFEPAGVNTDGADPRPPPASGISSSPASRGADCVNIQPPPASDNRDLPISRNADGMDPQPPPAPENRTPSILVDSMDTNDTSHLEKAAEQATNEQQPVLPPTHFFYQADREASPAGRNVDDMDPQPASTPDNRTPSFPVDSMDTDNTSPPEKTAELAMSNHSIHASQQPVFPPTDPFDQLPPADREALPIEAEDEEDMETDDLYHASSQDVLAANAFHCVSFTSSLAQTVDDLVYYRFGFSLHEISYSGVPSSISPVLFRNWHEVVCAVGGQGMNVSGTNQRAITDFLGCILSSENPLRAVPGKFWDLSADGADPLNELTPRFIRIEKRQFKDRPRYLLRPCNLHPTRDTSWCITVDALTALECIRRSLGPHSLDIANYFVDHGIPFSTLDHLRPTSQLPSSPSCLPRRVLGRRPKGYKFNLADYAAYVTLRDSYLSTQPHARAALCAGGIVARLARESLSAVAVLSGPSQSALEGKQVVLTWNGQHFCDDTVSEVDTDLICGVYEVETDNKGKILILTYFPLK